MMTKLAKEVSTSSELRFKACIAATLPAASNRPPLFSLIHFSKTASRGSICSNASTKRRRTRLARSGFIEATSNRAQRSPSSSSVSSAAAASAGKATFGLGACGFSMLWALSKACIFPQRAASRLIRNGLLTAPAMTPTRPFGASAKASPGYGPAAFNKSKTGRNAAPLRRTPAIAGTSSIDISTGILGVG